MLGKLEENQIEELLTSQYIGRIGCHADDITYVVPVNYVYDGDCIYAHSGVGMKINMLRKNPKICFQVDLINDMLNWKSVVVWGRYEEILERSEKERVMQLIANRIGPFLAGDRAHPSHGITEDVSDIGVEMELILYKIILDRKTGRFEKS